MLSWLTVFLCTFHLGIAASGNLSLFLARISKYDGMPVLDSDPNCCSDLSTCPILSLFLSDVWKLGKDGILFVKLAKETWKDGVVDFTSSTNKDVTVLICVATRVVESLAIKVLFLAVTIPSLLFVCAEFPHRLCCNFNLLKSGTKLNN